MGVRVSLLGTRDEPADSVLGSVARGWKLGWDWRAQISITVLHINPLGTSISIQGRMGGRTLKPVDKSPPTPLAHA